jgi:hypothetical protein
LFEKLEKCPTCGASRYKWNDIYNDEDRASSNAKKRKKKGAKTYAPDPTEEADNTCLGINENKRRIPALVMCYLNPIDCLRHMLANPREAKLMHWWHDERTDDEGKLTQPADGT